MRRHVYSAAAYAAIVLAVAGLVGCVLPNQPSSTPPNGTYSTADLLANFDLLQGPASRSLVSPGRSVFSLPGGGQLSLRDLSTYLNAIKTDFSGYVSSVRTGSSPYLVTAVKLSWGGSNSGLMWVPFTWFRSAKFPVISYQHGTQVYRPLAPSRFNVNPFAVFSSPDPSGALQNYVECIVGALMASAGYIVVMPDYQGFGDSTVTHPYVTDLLADAVSGAVRAASTALAWNPVKPNGKLFLTGYSEGGYVTMVGSKALGPAVTATVAADGPYDLSNTMVKEMLSTTPPPPKVPWYLLYTVSGFHAAYGLDPKAVLKSDSIRKLGLFDGNHTNAQVDAVVPFGTYPRDIVLDSAITDLEGHGRIYRLIAENDGWVGWKPAGPVVLIHCPQDDIVPVENRDAAVAALDEAGFGRLVRTVDVPAVPFVDTLLGSIHGAAYPTAMLAAFVAIQTINTTPL